MKNKMIVVLSLAMLMPGLSKANDYAKAAGALACGTFSYAKNEVNAPLFEGVTPVRIVLAAAAITVGEAVGKKMINYDYISWTSYTAWKNYVTSLWSKGAAEVAAMEKDAKPLAGALAAGAAAASDALTQPTPSVENDPVRSKLARKA